MPDDIHHIVTADSRVARLYAARPTPGGSVQLRQIDSIRNEHEEEHERRRPDMLEGPGRRNAPAGLGPGVPHFASPRETEEEEEEMRRFAREVAQWLGRVRRQAGGGGVTIFAASRFLGMLRKELGPDADLREAELAQMPEHELQDHRAIRDAVLRLASKR